VQLVDHPQETTPGLRLLEKKLRYSKVGGACNHGMGLDDAVMIKDEITFC
jgi:nicotinate-nucleotide pyrophosphorylase (carboxylating)